jgi:hypothetical protein
MLDLSDSDSSDIEIVDLDEMPKHPIPKELNKQNKDNFQTFKSKDIVGNNIQYAEHIISK